MVTTLNLFISHSWAYGDAYDRLVEMLNERSYFSWNNYSVPEDDPIHTTGSDKELQTAIESKISLCHAELVLAGGYSTYSKWINKEIDAAQDAFSVPTPILAIEPWGSEKTSSVVKDAADVTAKWNTESIISAIRSVT